MDKTLEFRGQKELVPDYLISISRRVTLGKSIKIRCQGKLKKIKRALLIE